MATSVRQSLLDLAIRWGQVLAVAAAGVWAVFQFGVSEASKTMVLELDVDAKVGAPLAGEYFGGLIPITVDIRVRNAGDKGVNIILGSAVFGTELFPDLQKEQPRPVRPYSSLEEVGFNYSADFGERAYGNSFAFELFAPSYWMDPGEHKNYQVLTFGYSEEDALFSYEVYFHAAARCDGIFPFTTCYEFITNVTELPSEGTCSHPLEIEAALGGDIPLCFLTFRRVEGSSKDLEPVSSDEMLLKHNLITYDRHGTVIYRHPVAQTQAVAN